MGEESEARWFHVLSAADLAEGDVIGVVVEAHEIAIYHLPGGEYCATANVCTHGQAYLSEGWIVDDCQIECPLHAGCFEIRTGKAMGPPVDEDLAVYKIKQEGDEIFVYVPL